MFAISMPNFLPDDQRVREKRDSFVQTWKDISKESPVPIVILAMNDEDNYLKEKYDQDHLYVVKSPNLPLIPARILLDVIIKDITGINYVLGVDDDFAVKPQFLDWIRDHLDDDREFFQLCASNRYLFTALSKTERCYDNLIERVDGDRKRVPAGTKLWEAYNYDFHRMAPKFWTKEGFYHKVGDYRKSLKWMNDYATINDDEEFRKLIDTIMYIGSDDMLLVVPQAYLHGFDIDKVRGLNHKTARSDTKDPEMFNYSTVPKSNPNFPDISVTTQIEETNAKSSKLTRAHLEAIDDMSLVRKIYEDPDNQDTLSRLAEDFGQSDTVVK